MRAVVPAAAIVVAAGMACAVPPPTPAPPRLSDVSAPEARGLITEAWKRLDTWFYEPSRLTRALDELARTNEADGERDQHAVIRRMLAAVDASHTDLYTPDQPEYAEALDIYSFVAPERVRTLYPGGTVTTVGIDVTTREVGGRHFVRFVWEGGPADLAGVKVGDEIVAANGSPFHPIRSFRAQEERRVRLTIRRQRGGAPEHIHLTPHRVQPRAAFARAVEASTRVVERGSRRIGYLRAHAYLGDETHESVLKSLEDLLRRDAEALVLDLRGGWGGASPDRALAFVGIAPDVVMTDRQANSSRISRARAEPQRRVWNRPLVVLIDPSVRSGKEVLAATFLSAGVPLVGERTAGAVLGGKPFLLGDDSLLIVAVTDIEVDGTRLEGVGVEPTIPVPFEWPYAAGDDPPLERAIDEAMRRAGERPRPIRDP